MEKAGCAVATKTKISNIIIIIQDIEQMIGFRETIPSIPVNSLTKK